MIAINRLHEFLLELQAEVNNRIDNQNWVLSEGMWIDDDHWIDNAPFNISPEYGKVIDHLIISPTESHLQKKIGDKRGIVLAVKMPDCDSEIESVDNYLEQNHHLFFVIEKISPDKVKDDTERAHYGKLQYIMKLVKEYMLECGMNSVTGIGDETLTKPFRTEWEYNIFGGFNGLSISFDLKDYSL